MITGSHRCGESLADYVMKSLEAKAKEAGMTKRQVISSLIGKILSEKNAKETVQTEWQGATFGEDSVHTDRILLSYASQKGLPTQNRHAS